MIVTVYFSVVVEMTMSLDDWSSSSCVSNAANALLSPDDTLTRTSTRRNPAGVSPSRAATELVQQVLVKDELLLSYLPW